MIPQTLSPSSLTVFEGCPARFNAENIQGRAASLAFHSGDPANLGTACHTAIEEFVKAGHHLDPKASFTSLQAAFTIAYWSMFTHGGMYEVGIKMLENWYNRRDFSSREVLSTEEKKFFLIPVTMPDGTKGHIQFNYIMDRLDKLDNGELEVVDYKSITRPVGPDELKNKIQARCYALAVQLEHPDVERIWVTFDLLRYSPVSVPFSKEDNRETWKYLRRVAQRIVDSDGTQEIINDSCRFCVRKAECVSLQTFAQIAGPIFEEENFDEVVAYRYRAKAAMDALKQTIGQADEVIQTFLDENVLTEADAEDFVVKIKSRSERRVDSSRAAQIVGPDLAARYGKLGVKEIEAVLDDPNISDVQRSQLKTLIRKDVTSTWVEVKPKKEMDVATDFG